MKILYLECGMGAAGDMLMAALLELHHDKEGFVERMNRIGIPGVKVAAESSVKCGITGTHMSVKVNGMEEESMDSYDCGQIHEHDHSHEQAHDHSHSHEAHQHDHAGINDIYSVVDGLDVPDKVKEDVKNIYRSIAEAESRVHGKPVTQVHFHEVGTADAIADITGCALLMQELQVDKVVTSPVNVGFGHVRCAHGILPVPAPATSLLLEGVPCYAGSVEGELCTPTGAAVVKYYTSQFGRMPQMMIQKTGYGMGRKDFETANCVRAVLGETLEGAEDEIIELRCNLDDMTPEETGYAMEVLLARGALDVFTTAVGMKKSRPGTLLTVMCSQQDKEDMAELVFRHTSTIGIREYACRRMVLNRSEKILASGYGSVRIKESRGYGVHKEKMEFEDLKRIAAQTGMSIREIKKNLGEQ